jgi:hypothetical protein
MIPCVERGLGRREASGSVLSALIQAGAQCQANGAGLDQLLRTNRNALLAVQILNSLLKNSNSAGTMTSENKLLI